MMDRLLGLSNLTNADLTGADLQDSDLRAINFIGTNLTNANLKGSNLQGSSFVGAIININQLEEATLLCTQLPDGSVAKPDDCYGGTPDRWER